MSYLVFARKWRPQDFDEIVGQGHIAATLKNAIKLNRVAQAYLFTGPRGVGKTSTARILAKALNCKNGPTPHPCNKCPSCLEITASNSLDVMEIDGASNRGIDEIRALRENVKFAPANAKFKIYIIDEVHQITSDGFNALLKTLEEPPPHIKFIFATTQPGKIPATILSRCQRFDFKRVSIADIVKKLKEIAKAEKIDAQEGVFFEVARAADGSMRDAESILDQLNSFCEKKIEDKDVSQVLGVIEEELLLKLADFIAEKDIASILRMIDGLTNDGKDLYQFLARLIEHVRNLTMVKVNKNLSATLALSEETLKKLVVQSDKFNLEDLVYFFYLLSNSYESAKKTGFIRFALEFALIKVARREAIIPIEELLQKVKKLESNPPANVLPPAPHAPPPPASSPPLTSQQTDSMVGPSASLGEIESGWTEVIKRLNVKKPSLASFLMEGAPIAFEAGVVNIGFPKMHKFHKEILEKPENKRIIEDIATDTLGKKIKIDFTLVDKLERGNNFKLEFTQDVQDTQTVDPVVKDAMDVFKGLVVNNKNFKSHG